MAKIRSFASVPVRRNSTEVCSSESILVRLCICLPDKDLIQSFTGWFLLRPVSPGRRSRHVFDFGVGVFTCVYELWLGGGTRMWWLLMTRASAVTLVKSELSFANGCGSRCLCQFRMSIEILRTSLMLLLFVMVVSFRHTKVESNLNRAVCLLLTSTFSTYLVKCKKFLMIACIL